MISAKEAREMSEKANDALMLEAKKWVKDELEFIENHILDAIEKGEYRTSYFWSASIFKGAGIREKDTRVFLRNALEEAGYNCNIRIDKQCSAKRMVVDINWEEDDDE